MRDDLRWPLGFLVMALLAMAITTEVDGADLPVVFIPGTGGTRLVERRPDGERRVWIAPSLLEEADGNAGTAGIDRMMLTSEGEDGETKLVPAETLRTLSLGVHLELRVADPEMTRIEDSYTTRGLIDLKRFSVPVYGDFFEWARGQWSSSGGFYDVPYDWRKGACETSDVAIGAKVDQALKKSGQAQVVLVAHSLGGLVARHYLCQGQNAKKVRALIAVGTPWLGSPKTARALRYGYSFGLGGRVDPPDEYIAKGIYIYYNDRRESHRVRYPTIVSLLDPAKTKALAKTLPCVFQQLPTPEYAEFYARAIGSTEQRVSVFLGETWDQTFQTFEDANTKLFNAAQDVRKRTLYNGNHGVSHVLIAGTLDPRIATELAMDMRMSEETEQNAALRWIGHDNEITSPFGLISALTTTGPPFFDALKTNFKRLRAGEKITPEAMKALANRFFGLVPLFEDFGNYNWQYVRRRALSDLRAKKKLPIFLEHYVAIHSDAMPLDQSTPRFSPRWGDGTAPLLSATAGYKDKLSPEHDINPMDEDNVFDQKAPEQLLGTGTKVIIRKLGRDKNGNFLDHSRMLDDDTIREQIRAAYSAACQTSTLIPDP